MVDVDDQVIHEKPKEKGFVCEDCLEPFVEPKGNGMVHSKDTDTPLTTAASGKGYIKRSNLCPITPTPCKENGDSGFSTPLSVELPQSLNVNGFNSIKNEEAVVSGVNGSPCASDVNGSPCTNGVNGGPYANGVNGIPCANGVNGIPCANGVNGSPCANGIIGSPCANGTIGIPCANGTSGSNGSPCTNCTNGSPCESVMNGSPPCASDTNGSPRTPDEGVFDPFAPGPDELLLAPIGKKLVKESRKMVARRLNFDDTDEFPASTDDNKDSDTLSENVLLESFYETLLEAIIRVQSEEFLAENPSLEPVGLHTPPSPPPLLGVADTCPGAPMKAAASKSINIDRGLCRKLEF